MMNNCKYLFLIIGYGILFQLTMANQGNSACGVRPLEFQRVPRDESNNKNKLNNVSILRNPKIISGTITKEGNFPWQVSLELLHPSLGGLGHWCGAVLIDPYWIISAAHCVHNDLFNLPLAILWTAVLGEYDRNIESGYEQRISIEKIVMHDNYHNFQNDLVLMKLSRPANISPSSRIKQICLPFINIQTNIKEEETDDDVMYHQQLNDITDLTKNDNFLRNMKWKKNDAKLNIKEILMDSLFKNIKKTRKLTNRRRNDKFFQEKNTFERKSDSVNTNNFYKRKNHGIGTSFDNKEITYSDCIATGWGQSKVNGDLTNILLKSKVPIHNNSRCDLTYGGFVKIHKGHLCAGRLDGKGGTCVGDSGGPLVCRLFSLQTSPWILVGVTSFGSGCALKGYPDVYTRISYYMKWITETISKNDFDYDKR